MDSVGPSLQLAVANHGLGSVHAVLDGLAQAHAVQLDKAPHGMFIKCFCPTKQISVSQRHWGSPKRFNIGDSDFTTPSGSTPSSSSRSSHSPSSPGSRPDSTGSSASRTTLGKTVLLRLRCSCKQDEDDIPNLPKTMRNSNIECFVAHVPYTVKNTFVHVRGELSGADEFDNVSTASAPPGLLACELVEPGEVVGQGFLQDLVSQPESHDVLVQPMRRRSLAVQTGALPKPRRSRVNGRACQTDNFASDVTIASEDQPALYTEEQVADSMEKLSARMRADAAHSQRQLLEEAISEVSMRYEQQIEDLLKQLSDTKLELERKRCANTQRKKKT